MRMKPSTLSPARKLTLFVFALIALYGGYYWGNKEAPINRGLQLIQLLEMPLKVMPFVLDGPEDEPFTEADLAGHWSLIFFGYTGDGGEARHQMTLATRIFNRLAQWPELQGDTSVVLVTVDPARDSREQLADFVGHFSSDFTGLTGDPAQIAGLASQLGMKYRQLADPAGGYTISHSSSIALVNPRGELLGLFTGRVDPSTIASDIKQLADDYQ